jgi:hypothetical protein
MIANRLALKEAVTDTAIALVINYPLNILVLYVTFCMELTSFQTATALTAVFTVVAIIRKYFVRTYFSKKDKKQ